MLQRFAWSFFNQAVLKINVFYLERQFYERFGPSAKVCRPKYLYSIYKTIMIVLYVAHWRPD